MKSLLTLTVAALALSVGAVANESAPAAHSKGTLVAKNHGKKAKKAKKAADKKEEHAAPTEAAPTN